MKWSTIAVAALASLMLATAADAAPGASDFATCINPKLKNATARIEACTIFLDAGRAAPVNRWSAHSFRGAAYLAAGKSDLALADFEQTVSLAESYRLNVPQADMYGNRGLALQKLGKLDAAISDYDRAIRFARDRGLVPTLVTIYTFRGTAYQSLGKFDRAITDCQQALALARNHTAATGTLVLAHVCLSGSFQLLLKFEQSIAEGDQAVDLARTGDVPASTRMSAYAIRGFAYQQVGRLDESIADYDQAIGIDAKNAFLYSDRGNSWQMKGDLDRAIADHERAIALDPTVTVFLNNRGRDFREKGDFDRALADFSKAIEQSPNLEAPYTGRGLTWHAKGDLKRALEDYDTAIRIEPKLPEPYVGRGLTYEEMGDKQRARADFATALGVPQHTLIKLPSGHYAINVGVTRYINIAKTRLALLTTTDMASAPSKAAAPQRAPTPTQERRIALVIGNGGYRNAPQLINPPHDAHAIAKALRDLGFDVSEGIDLDRSALEKSLRNFLVNAGDARLAILFYAGHGMQVDGHSYLVPVDASFETANDVVKGLTDLDTILIGLDNQIRANLVILDACRDNPLASKTVADNGASRSVAVRSGLAAPANLGRGEASGAGTLLAFATAPGRVALDGDGDNSPFSTALIRHIGTPGLEVQQMLTRVRAEVVATTKGKQVPWSNSSLLGEVYLAGRP